VIFSKQILRHASSAERNLIVAVLLLAVYDVVNFGRSYIWLRHFSPFLGSGMMMWVLVFFVSSRLLESTAGRLAARRANLIALCLIWFLVTGKDLLSASANQERHAGAVATARGSLVVDKGLVDTLERLQRVLGAEAEDEQVLFVPHGSGFNYLLGRDSPSGSMQFIGYLLSEERRAKYLELIQAKPPVLLVKVVGEKAIRLSEQASRDLNPELWDYIDENYEKERVIDGTVLGFEIYRRRQASATSD
jgi:hypothetical protein